NRYQELELDLYAALQYSALSQLIMQRNNVSATTSLIHTSAPLFVIVRGLFGLSAFAGLVMLFRPLLTGIGRALVLLFKPRLSKAELAIRRRQRDAMIVQEMIDSSHGPSHA